jgi:hypothetical protein
MANALGSVTSLFIADVDMRKRKAENGNLGVELRGFLWGDFLFENGEGGNVKRNIDALPVRFFRYGISNRPTWYILSGFQSVSKCLSLIRRPKSVSKIMLSNYILIPFRPNRDRDLTP